MSRAFVKEPDGDESAGELSDLPQSPHPNYVTPTGLRQLEDRLAAFEAERQAIDADDGGLATKLALARIAREIRYFEARLESAIPIDPAGQPRDRVAFGALVSVAEEDDGARRAVQIVGEDESDPKQGKISWVSPLARALQDAEVGDLVTWHRPNGDMELEILAIELPAG
jgi:transcription elongation GreA/GreB family factor